LKPKRGLPGRRARGLDGFTRFKSGPRLSDSFRPARAVRHDRRSKLTA
jgi:hypothetical protein